MKNLQNYGVQELGHKETKNTNGGGFGWGIALLMYLAYETVTNPVSSGKSFLDGFNSGSNY
jgi:hypothetical protein